MPGLLKGIARTAVAAGTAKTVSNRVSRRQTGKWAQQGQQEQAQVPAQATAPAADRIDPLAELKQLGELRDSGVLTEEEFQQQKQRILST